MNSNSLTMIEVNDGRLESNNHDDDVSKARVIDSNTLVTVTDATSTNPLGILQRTPSPPSVNSVNNNSAYSLTSVITSYSAKHTSPVNLTLCTLIMCLASGSVIIAGYLIQNLMTFYRSPGVLAYLSVSSLQCFFLLIRRSSSYPKRRADGRPVITESDFGCDTYTNREVKK